MRRLVIPVVVVVLALLAGVAVSGRPTTITDDVSIGDIQVVASTRTSPSVGADSAATTDAP